MNLLTQLSLLAMCTLARGGGNQRAPKHALLLLRVIWLIDLVVPQRVARRHTRPRTEVIERKLVGALEKLESVRVFI